MTSIVDLANKKKEWAAATSNSSSAPKTPSVVKQPADKPLPALTPKAKSVSRQHHITPLTDLFSNILTYYYYYYRLALRLTYSTKVPRPQQQSAAAAPIPPPKPVTVITAAPKHVGIKTATQSKHAPDRRAESKDRQKTARDQAAAARRGITDD